jgi:hypothetical protein
MSVTPQVGPYLGDALAHMLYRVRRVRPCICVSLIPGGHERTEEKEKYSPSVSYPAGTLCLMEVMPAPANQVEENFLGGPVVGTKWKKNYSIN